MVNELQRFPVLRKRMDEVIGNFLREGLEPSETMIGHIIEMEVLCIWTYTLFSHLVIFFIWPHKSTGYLSFISPKDLIQIYFIVLLISPLTSLVMNLSYGFSIVILFSTVNNQI